MYGAGDMSASDLHTINACKSRGVEIRNRYECTLARARLEDIPLPPVTLIRVGEEYYVRDGRHRISVAGAYGQLVIEAQVTAYDLAPRLALNQAAQAAMIG